MSKEFFPKKSEATPTIYAYELPNDSSRKGQLKVGDTNRTAQQRIKEQIGAARSAFKIVVEQSAMRNDGSGLCTDWLNQIVLVRFHRCTK